MLEKFSTYTWLISPIVIIFIFPFPFPIPPRRTHCHQSPIFFSTFRFYIKILYFCREWEWILLENKSVAWNWRVIWCDATFLCQNMTMLWDKNKFTAVKIIHFRARCNVVLVIEPSFFFLLMLLLLLLLLLLQSLFSNVNYHNWFLFITIVVQSKQLTHTTIKRKGMKIF